MGYESASVHSPTMRFTDPLFTEIHGATWCSHKSPPLVSILCQIIPIQNLAHYNKFIPSRFRYYLINALVSAFPVKILYACTNHSRATKFHLSDLVTIILFFESTVFLNSSILLLCISSQVLKSWFIPQCENHVSHRRDNIIVLCILIIAFLGTTFKAQHSELSVGSWEGKLNPCVPSDQFWNLTP